MRIPFLALLLVATAAQAAAPERREVGQLVFDGVPEIPAQIAERMSQYQNTRGATLLDWTPDAGSMLITTRFGDTNQLHLVRQPAGAREQLTFFDEPVRFARFDPAGKGSRLVFMRDAGGGEFYQFYALDLSTGRTQLLTDGKSRNEDLVFSHSSSRFAYVSTRRNGRDFDIYVQDASDPGSARLVREVQGRWAVLAWSPDDRKLLVQRYVSINESYLHVLDVLSGELTELNPKAGARISYDSGDFVTDDVVVYTSDEGSEFLRLVRHELKSGRKTVLTPDLKWDVSGVTASHDGKWIAYVTNEGGRSALYLARGPRFDRAERVELPVGVVTGLRFDPKTRRLGFSLNGATAPEDAWSLDLRSRKLTRWTFSEVGGLNPATFVEPRIIEFASFDGRKIPSWYFPGKGEGKRPVIINIHGGPESQSSAYFNPLAQYWVNELGAAVLLPNVRGSSGYGKTYLQLDDAEKRMDSVKDIGALLDWVSKQPELDASRVAVIGGSYGGFMTLASMVDYGDRLRCGVDIVGISHFVTFLEKTESYRRDLRRVEYGDERDPKMRKFLNEISPLTNAKKITKPLFVVQGANDPRVPLNEAEQIVETVRSNGGTVWYLLAKDEGHGFQKKRNRDAYLNATALFFERCLLD